MIFCLRKGKITVLVIYMRLPRPPLIVLLHPALTFGEVVQFRPLCKNVPSTASRMHLFSSVVWKVCICECSYMRYVFIT